MYSLNEQLLGDGQAGPTHVAIDVILMSFLIKDDSEHFQVALYMEMNDRVIHQCTRMLKYNIVKFRSTNFLFLFIPML
jgi:hypothetical protein